MAGLVDYERECVSVLCDANQISLVAAHWLSSFPHKASTQDLSLLEIRWTRLRKLEEICELTRQCYLVSLSLCAVSPRKFLDVQSDCDGQTSRIVVFGANEMFCFLFWRGSFCCQVAIIFLIEMRNSVKCVGGRGVASCSMTVFLFVCLFVPG